MKRLLTMALLGLVAQLSVAAEVRQITWETLTAHLPPPMDNPFDSLSDLQLDRLSIIADVVDNQAQGLEVNPELMEQAEIERVILTQEGLDVDQLFKTREKLIEQYIREGKTTNPELNQQRIEMRGFFLPLEFTGQLVSEFLLVPYIGACIHEPPPPPNQIVYARLTSPVPPPTHFYTIVKVRGLMRTEAANPELSLVDGASQIETGYQLVVDDLEFEASQ
ncbi:DUF3299 domain-containing protein [Motiliproteus sediminis]|uniref:DUF3299 domain-containing protein n=1 Tax=Motiliproteus sediminis TaxID=1468178 RepID=UPI001FECE8F9|nr:DUF3299 domain-containing protein [Motiliproteus sediminis]